MKQILLVLVILLSFSSNLALSTSITTSAKGVLVLSIKDTINPGTSLMLTRAIAQAAQNHQWLILELNTPGGLLTSTRDMVSAIIEAPVPVVVYVAPAGGQAASAGMMITIAAHYAAMTPGTNIGAAHPVSGVGQEIKGEMKDKVVNDTAAFVKSIATLRKRNIEKLEKGVRESASYTDKEALDTHIVDGVFETEQDLIAHLQTLSLTTKDHGTWTLAQSPTVTQFDPSLRETFISLIGNPNIAFMLLAIGGIGLYVELSHPGLIFPGVVGGLSLLLALISLQMLPVQWGALALFFLGFALLIAEMFVTSFGFLGIGGIVGIVLGALYLFDPTQGIGGVDVWLIIATVAGIMAISGIIILSLLHIRKAPKSIGSSDLTGQIAVVKIFDASLRQGTCFVSGSLWHFSTGASHLAIGDQVMVDRQEGLHLFVSPAKSDRIASS